MPMSLAVPAAIPSPPAEFSSFSLGPLTIHAYALCILAGIILALWMTSVRWKRRGLPPDAVWDIAIWAIPFGIIGGRLYHVISSPDAYFGPNGNLALIPQIWLGGLGIWGAIALGAVGAWIGCRRAGIKLSTFADVAAPGVLLAQAVGRWGNWFNQELFGGPTDLPWGLEIDESNAAWPEGLPPGTLFHPTFLYEVIWNLLGVAVLLILERKFRLQWGKVLGLYLIWYGLGRTVWESIRVDPSEVFFGLRVNIWAALLAILVGVIILVVQSRRHTGFEPSPYVPGREWAGSDAGVQSSHTDSDYVDISEPESPAVGSSETAATSEIGSKS